SKTNQQDEVFFPRPDAITNQQRLVYTKEDTPQLSAIQLKPEELVDLDLTASQIEIISPLETVDFTG
ncbi:MAG: hypothetical protein F6K10_43960, partial [Moorea sp. SIO2B7]|nr:hypothetical protein [Moorena sp. SIO2B7]